MMVPIDKLLSRILWDKEFGKGSFVIGYYDRIEKKIVKVPFSALIFTPGERSSVKLMDSDGIVHTIPLHRIKEVYRNNKLIWQRPL